MTNTATKKIKVLLLEDLAVSLKGLIALLIVVKEVAVVDEAGDRAGMSHITRYCDFGYHYAWI